MTPAFFLYALVYESAPSDSWISTDSMLAGLTGVDLSPPGRVGAVAMRSTTS